MKLVSFSTDGSIGLRSGVEIAAGIADTEQVAALARVGANGGQQLRATRGVLALPPADLAKLARAANSHAEQLRDRGALHDAGAVRLGPPIPDPEKIICLGLNYRDHAREAGLSEPAAPMFFAKWANSLIGPTDPIVPPRTGSEQVDYEAELAVVIGKPARNIEAAHALEHVAGAMAFNDVSARDLQMANNLWTGGKAIDTFGPCGPALVTADEIADLQALPVRARVNGETVQDGNTAEMIFSVADTIAFLSQIMTLAPGDIIATGTPAGIGNARDPKLFPAPRRRGRGRDRRHRHAAKPSRRGGLTPTPKERTMATTTTPHPTLHHVNLKTVRLQEMIDWYALVVGIEPTHQYEGGAWLSNDAANHRLALLTVPGMEDDPDKVRHTGIHHTAFEYPSMDDLLDTYVRLKGHGILPHACLDHGMTMSFYYLDPDGNSVELQYDQHGDWSESKHWMHTSREFAANPIGVNVDPEQVVAARDQGATRKEVHRRAYAGEFTPKEPLDLRLPEPAADHA